MMRTKKEFLKFYRAEILPSVRKEYESLDNRVDAIARREAWNNVIDYLVQDRELPKRALEWDCPW